MATHYIPRDVKGEGRILYIFTSKSLMTTGGGGIIGVILYFIFAKLLGLTLVGIILLAIFAFIGFAIGTFKIPQITGLQFTKNIAGDSLDEIIVRFFKFKMNRRIYTYTKEEK